jgi:hypothetical protein
MNNPERSEESRRGRGRPVLTHWARMRIGDGIRACPSCATNWTRKLAPKVFVSSGAYVYRIR